MFQGSLRARRARNAAALARIDGPLTEDALRGWLTRRIASQVEIDPSQIDPAERFDSYGLDSLIAVSITGDIEKLVKRPLSPALLFEYATIDALARHLANPQAPDAQPSAYEAW